MDRTEEFENLLSEQQKYQMKKLQDNASKRSYKQASLSYFRDRVNQELEEMDEAMRSLQRDPRNKDLIQAVVDECSDVSNFLSFIIERVQNRPTCEGCEYAEYGMAEDGEETISCPRTKNPTDAHGLFTRTHCGLWEKEKPKVCSRKRDSSGMCFMDDKCPHCGHDNFDHKLF